MILSLVLFAAGLLAYSLPWIAGPGASLTLNAYDLAEWTSLHPWVRTANPPLVVTFMLRALPALLALLLFTTVARSWRRYAALIVFIVAVALLPPAAFFSSAFNDPNFRQQAVLALLTLFGLVLSVRLRWSPVIFAALLVLGSVIAVINSQVLMNAAFALPVSPGPGGPLFVLIVLLFGLHTYKRGQLTLLATSSAETIRLWAV